MRTEKHSTWKPSRTSLYYLSSTLTGCNNAFSKLNRQTNCNWCTVLKKGSLDSWRLDNAQSFFHLLLSCSTRLLVISVSILYNIRLNRRRLGSPLVCHAPYSKCLSSAGSLLLLLSNNSNGHFNSITSATGQITQRPSSFLSLKSTLTHQSSYIYICRSDNLICISSSIYYKFKISWFVISYVEVSLSQSSNRVGDDNNKEIPPVEDVAKI